MASPSDEELTDERTGRPATLAEHCDNAAEYLQTAASALRHGRLTTAREKLAAAQTVMVYLRRQLLD